MFAYDFMGVHDASGLHVAGLKGLKWPNLEICVNRGFEEIQISQATRQVGVLVTAALPGSNAFQILRIAEDAKEMIGTYLPKAQIRIPAVVNAQSTMDVQYRRTFTPCLARFIDRPMQGGSAREKCKNGKDSSLHSQNSGSIKPAQESLMIISDYCLGLTKLLASWVLSSQGTTSETAENQIPQAL